MTVSGDGGILAQFEMVSEVKIVRVRIALAQIPFTHNPVECLAAELRLAAVAAGHLAEIVRIPYRGSSTNGVLDSLLALRLLAFDTSPEDCLVALEYPAHLVPHPRKVLWLARGDAPPPAVRNDDGDSRAMGEAISVVRHSLERRACTEARRVFAISATLSSQWRKRSGLDAVPLYPPLRLQPASDRPSSEDFILVPAAGGDRLVRILEALRRTRQPIALRFLGEGAEARSALEQCGVLAGLEGRCRWLPGSSENADLYARCRAVVAVPLAETNPEVALLAMWAGKPLITSPDSGALAELVLHRQTGWVVDAEPAVLAWAMDEAWSRKELSRRLGQAGRAQYAAMNLDWSRVVERLLGPFRGEAPGSSEHLQVPS